MARTYTTQIRVLLCQQCGAPLETAPAGGVIACGYCRAQNQVAKRRDDQLSIAAPSGAPIDEGERIRRLRMQDGKPLVPPPSLHPLLAPGGGGFHPAKVEEAFHVYQATRREVQATSSPEAAERLYVLTLLANSHLIKAGDHARRRAILETSLDTLSLPRHRQVLRCMLASASAKERDLSSAEQWLAPCNPRSDDLQADSAFRVARAFVDTVAGRFDKVVATLGSVDDAYPIDDSWDPTAAVLRANALERLGQLDAAVQALRARMSKEQHAGRRAMAQILETHRELSLCAASYPRAQQVHSHQAASSAGQKVDGGVGTVFLVVGVGVCLLGGILFLAIAAPMMMATLSSGGGIAAALAEGGFVGGIICVTTVPLGLIFAGVGGAMRRSAKRAAWLRMNGISAMGTVRGHQGTGVSINNVPQVEVQVEVHHPSRGPYTASFKQLLSGELAPYLAPGAQVPLRVHPEDPSQIMLELS